MKFLDFLKFDRTNKILSGLLNKDNEEMVKRMTVLQNEISVSFDTKVIAITSTNNDSLAAAFALGFANAYSKNGATVLIVDANLYNPSLKGHIGSDIEVKEGKEEYQITKIDDKVDAICLNQEIYPSDVFKSGKIHSIIKDNEQYDHIIVLVPSIKEHKEVSLLSDIINTILLIAQKNSTRKGNIYNAAVYFAQEKLPLAKLVILE